MLNIDRSYEFPQLPADAVYADWTGAALPPRTLIEEHARFLTSTLFGNPHSHHAPSQHALELAQAARAQVLRHFNADPAQYEVVWTPNASGAILLLQHYMFEGGELLLTADNHNTVNGLREIARRNGAVVRYAPLLPDLSLDAAALEHRLAHPRTSHNRLFGYPGKSNYSGIEHPLEWVNRAHAHGWDVLLDAAAFAANNDLDLSAIQPEFVPISFYKLFGFPTGVGCLLVKRSAYPRLFKRWFAGGTILLVSVMANFYALEPPSPARFEDGTINFGMLPAVTRGLEWLKTIGDRKAHAVRVATRLYDELVGMRVGRGSIGIHSPRGTDVVTFSVLCDGETVNAWEVEKAANAVRTYFRTGCFCNPGANEQAMGYTVEEFERTYNDGACATDFTLDKLREHSGGKPIGAVRASFGYANVLQDADRIAEFLHSYLARL